MERRPPKESDQEQVQVGFQLVMDLMSKNEQIEPTLWASVMWSILVHGYNHSGMTYEQFTREWDQLKYHYKPWFDK